MHRCRLPNRVVNVSQIKDLGHFDIGAVAKSEIWTSTARFGLHRNCFQSYLLSDFSDKNIIQHIIYYFNIFSQKAIVTSAFSGYNYISLFSLSFLFICILAHSAVSLSSIIRIFSLLPSSTTIISAPGLFIIRLLTTASILSSLLFT